VINIFDNLGRSRCFPTQLIKKFSLLLDGTEEDAEDFIDLEDVVFGASQAIVHFDRIQDPIPLTPLERGDRKFGGMDKRFGGMDKRFG
jgi:hypothetical protein